MLAEELASYRGRDRLLVYGLARAACRSAGRSLPRCTQNWTCF
ncbi:hypothetical protein I553_3511 [Mycobacterium xenopi 4042]|uniref:Uncharacterized protein n=1 Tax=Mycobacterium xenopi 4042 TaxID=1299334 RepID=X7ZZ62_MYCXE|nr:hypothetical protein I553_3511 [Mycobacterium xenopi 4042]